MRDEMGVLESNFDYLEGIGFVDYKDNKTIRYPVRFNKLQKGQKGLKNAKVSRKSREFMGKLMNNHKDPRTWESEYLEHVLYKVCFALVRPFPPKKRELAKTLGLSLIQLQRLLNLPQYLQIKNSLRKELRSRYGADIDQIVIKQAMRGSGFHQALFYKLQGELIEKMEMTKKEDIPDDPEERNKMIEKYITQLGYEKQKERK